MPTKVETKTNELCQAILEHLQEGGVRQRIDTFLADDSARGQYESLMNKGQALQEKQHNGESLDPAEISAFEKDRDALLRNPVASGFLDAQEEMQDLQHSVQKFVSKTIELGRIPEAADLTEGSCGHGCGCHH
ncbi:MAG TPA: YlbF family regulator [Candidatus Acidoferrales bacterium]|nr:YlbF family regulator [Candidatus Acidoferrales bacterium]